MLLAMRYARLLVALNSGTRAERYFYGIAMRHIQRHTGCYIIPDRVLLQLVREYEDSKKGGDSGDSKH